MKLKIKSKDDEFLVKIVVLIFIAKFIFGL